MGKLKQILQTRAANDVAMQLVKQDSISKALSMSKHPIPVFVVSFNNGTYLKNMVEQLNRYEIVPIIFDNNSSELSTLKILDELRDRKAEIIKGSKNLGHLVGFLGPIYQLLPDVFAYTDPDLQFHPDLPGNFILDLLALTRQYECYKAGMALDISNFGQPKQWRSSTTRKFPFYFHKEHGILDWERQFWAMPLKHDSLEVYAAPIDTTFAVYNKKYFNNGDLCRGVRVAGNFSACHLPWYPNIDILSAQEESRYLKAKKVGFRE